MSKRYYLITFFACVLSFLISPIHLHAQVCDSIDYNKPTIAAGGHTVGLKEDGTVVATGGLDVSSWTNIRQPTCLDVSPSQATENLVTSITTIGLPTGAASSLAAPLEQISTLLNDNNTSNDTTACNMLDAFISQVNAKYKSGQLTDSQASQLLQSANQSRPAWAVNNPSGM